MVISVSAASELFLRFVTRTSALDVSDFQALKQHLIDRGNQFAEISLAAKAKIAELGERFLHGGCVVMVLGCSSVTLNLLETAASKGKFFTVIVVESKPGTEGLRMYKALERANIQVTMILDAQVAHKLEEVDMVLTGAEAVVESGGFINKIGTYQVREKKVFLFALSLSVSLSVSLSLFSFLLSTLILTINCAASM